MTDYRDSFINRFWPYAVQQSRRTGIDPGIILGQAAVETGWGRHIVGNNMFGIKGSGTRATTREFVNGRYITVNDSFSAFSSPEASFQGYGDFILRNPRYRPVMSAGTPGAQLAALQASRYATDPNYARTVGQVRNSIIARSGGGASVGGGGERDRCHFENGRQDPFGPASCINGDELIADTLDTPGRLLERVPIVGGLYSTMRDCGANPICWLQQWFESSHFIQRLVLAILAFIIIAAGLYLFKNGQIATAIKKAST